MKRILGLDLGTNSIGWAVVNEAENFNEQSSIVKVGVRVNPLTVDELTNFEKGKSITTNADRTLKRSARRNLHRYKLRRDSLIEVFLENKIISGSSVLCENGNNTTFETYRLRAKAVDEQISLEEFARVLMMINKKRGYKSSRKAKSADEGALIDGMEVAKELYNKNLTPGQYVLSLIRKGKNYTPDFYKSDLQAEFDRIWNVQKEYYGDVLTDEFKINIEGKGKQNTSKIFLGKYGIFTADNKGKDKKLQSYIWRVEALEKQLAIEEVAYVLSDLNGMINNSSGYLGAISDRSKELFFNNLTVGQYLMKGFERDPHFSARNKVFYRQDYIDEFEKIWQEQSKYYPQLTSELKREIKDIVIFYQRSLKSQKGLISFCELESLQKEIEINGKKKVKTIGPRVCPRSSPLFQEFKIWQILNNIEIRGDIKRSLFEEEKNILFKELSYKSKLSSAEALKLLFSNTKGLSLNYKSIDGNKTQAELFKAYQNIISVSGHGDYDFEKLPSEKSLQIVQEVFTALGINTAILNFDSSLEGKELENQAMYRLWHLLYSYEGDKSNSGIESLVEKLVSIFGFEKEYAKILTNVAFQDDYGSLSAKAIRKILPYMRDGLEYSKACELAGYRHSKQSLTKEELDNKVLSDSLKELPKNSLRNPVVEKILNQMVNVINSIIETYGKPDEIRVELARELKKSAAEREKDMEQISKATKEHEDIRKQIQAEFGFFHVSRNDVIRYRLYKELEPRGYKTLYSNTYIPKEKIFSGEFDIEHIIPQSRLFDDSFSNKTLEASDINREKGNMTAYDYVIEKYGEVKAVDYTASVKDLYEKGKISKTKMNKLLQRGAELGSGFIERDLRDTQYIAKKAKDMLGCIVRRVVSTTGSVTDRLREDWQLIDTMQELNWIKYDKLGLTEIIDGRDGQKIRRIKDWTKRNDHRHHAMDALTVAFTKESYIQYLNNLNARSDKGGSIYAIESKELERDTHNKLRFKAPMPNFRSEAKKQLENTLISIKAKNKVVTRNINRTRTNSRECNEKIQLTPRGQLHLETVFAKCKQYVVKLEKVGTSFTYEYIQNVANAKYREALIVRLLEYDGDPKKAFAGKNSLEKNPIWLDDKKSITVPLKVKVVSFGDLYTIRKEITPDLKLDKIVDKGVKKILEKRLAEYDGDAKKAFSNLDENPIYLNREKGIKIKRVAITGISNAIALHDKRDKFGNLILDADGNRQPVDFVNTGNNHHVAIYRDSQGNLQENVVSFYEATMRASQGFPVVDKDYKANEGWNFLFTMKQNEYFVFPNKETGFDPKEVDLMNPDNYSLISSNLFRVQKLASKYYVFRHHLETTVEDRKELQNITWIRVSSTVGVSNIVKVRINHIGQIVAVGEY